MFSLCLHVVKKYHVLWFFLTDRTYHAIKLTSDMWSCKNHINLTLYRLSCSNDYIESFVITYASPTTWNIPSQHIHSRVFTSVRCFDNYNPCCHAMSLPVRNETSDGHLLGQLPARLFYQQCDYILVNVFRTLRSLLSFQLIQLRSG